MCTRGHTSRIAYGSAAAEPSRGVSAREGASASALGIRSSGADAKVDNMREAQSEPYSVGVAREVIFALEAGMGQAASRWSIGPSAATHCRGEDDSVISASGESQLGGDQWVFIEIKSSLG
jgi:hypothetical protein